MKGSSGRRQKSDKVQCNVNLWWIDDSFVDTKSAVESNGTIQRFVGKQKVSLIYERPCFLVQWENFWHPSFPCTEAPYAVSQVRFQHESPRSPITKITINRRRNVTNQTAIYYCCSEELNELKMCVSSMQYSRPKWGNLRKTCFLKVNPMVHETRNVRMNF